MSRRHQAGYSLLEVIVAFAILALALSTILSLMATGLRNSAVAADYARALTLAEAQLAYYGALNTTRLEAGERQGREEHFHWRSRVTPYGEAGSEFHNSRLYRIEVKVDWGEEGRPRSLKLATLRLGATL